MGEQKSVLFHVHIPKCAGSSFRSLLQKHFLERHLNLYVNDTHFLFSKEQLADAIKANDPSSISSHFVRVFPRTIAGRRVRYVTFIRHPVKQFISYRNYICRTYNAIADSNLLRCLPPAGDKLSSREFARWVLTRSPEDAPFRENYITNFLAHPANDFTLRVDRQYKPRRIDIAKSVLDQFFFVGLVEKMQESYERLCELLNANGVHLPQDSVPIENVSNDFTDDTEWIKPSDEVGGLLLASLQDDITLYDWARRRLLGKVDASTSRLGYQPDGL